MNKVWLMGTVFRDPKSYKDGAVASFTLATSETSKTKDGNTRYENAYHNCAAFGNLATKVIAEVHDRSRVAVEGKITQEKKEREDGTSITYHGIKIDKLHIFPEVDLQEPAKAPRKQASAPKAKTLEEAETNIEKRQPVYQKQDDISIEDVPF